MDTDYIRLSLPFLIILFFASCAHKKITHHPQQRSFIHISTLKKIWANFHTVEPGVFYRAGQLSSHDLEKFIKKFSIKTVVNLRGCNEHHHWWRHEVDVINKCGITLYNIPMNAQQLPTKQNLITLLTTYETAPRPILIHCCSGADRTGEAAALWVLEQQKKDKKKALKQLTLKYGHLGAAHPIKRKFIHQWQGKHWLIEKYNPHINT